MIINLDSATPHLYYQAIIGMNVITSNTLLAGFLPNIVTAKNETFFNQVLERVNEFAALPSPSQPEKSLEVIHTKRERIDVTNL